MIAVMAEAGNHSKAIESGALKRYNLIAEQTTEKGLSVIYRQELIEGVILFTSQSASVFSDMLFHERKRSGKDIREERCSTS